MTIPHLMRRSQLEERLGLTRSSIYKMMDDGEFPRPMKIGRRAVGWRADEIAQWLERQQKATSNE
ncbi:AlpA family transcriptional regulator [bacterium]|nr:AlpA family transcriptional regulator [bacterium]